MQKLVHAALSLILLFCGGVVALAAPLDGANASPRTARVALSPAAMGSSAEEMDGMCASASRNLARGCGPRMDGRVVEPHGRGSALSVSRSSGEKGSTEGEA